MPSVSVPVKVSLDLSEIPEVERLHLEPGDHLVLTFPYRLDMAEAAHILERLRSSLPGVPVMILDDGAKFSVVSPDGA